MASMDRADQKRLAEAGTTNCCGVNTNVTAEAIQGKKIYILQVLLPFVPIMALIIQNCFNVVDVLQYQMTLQETHNQVKISTGLGNLTEALQSERAELAFYLFTNGSIVRKKLTEHFKYTNSLLDELEWPEFRIDDKLFHSKIVFQIRLDDFRDRIYKFDASSINAGIEFYNRANYIFLDQLTREIKEKDGSGVWRPLLAYKNMIRAIEHIGISMVFGEQYFGQGTLDRFSYISFVKNDAQGYDFLSQSQNFEFWIKNRYNELQNSYPYMANITIRRLEIIGRAKMKPDFDKATEYFHAMLGYLEILKKIQYEIRYNIEDTIAAEVAASNSSAIFGIAILVIVLIISAIIIFLVRMVTNALKASSEKLLLKTREIRYEREKGDKLQHHMLPRRVAKELNQQRRASTESFQSATVYYSDIVGFAELASKSTPTQMISLLNDLYKMIDNRLQKYAQYRVDTICDGYIRSDDLDEATATVPAYKDTEMPSLDDFEKDPSPVKRFFTTPIYKLMSFEPEDQHAGEIASLALEMLYAIENFNIPHLPNERLQIRIGIHTGPVVAGVIGKDMPKYCLFGETADIASFMEASGKPFKIQISEETKCHLDAIGGFIVKLRGELKMKAGVKMKTYWLIGKVGIISYSPIPYFPQRGHCHPKETV